MARLITREEAGTPTEPEGTFTPLLFPTFNRWAKWGNIPAGHIWDCVDRVKREPLEKEPLVFLA